VHDPELQFELENKSAQWLRKRFVIYGVLSILLSLPALAMSVSMMLNRNGAQQLAQFWTSTYTVLAIVLYVVGMIAVFAAWSLL